MKGPLVKCIVFALLAVSCIAAHGQAQPVIPAYCNGPGGSVPDDANYCALRAQNVSTIFMCNCQEAREMSAYWWQLQAIIQDCQTRPQSQWATCQQNAVKQYNLEAASAGQGAVNCIQDILIPMDEGYPNDCVNNSGGGGVNGGGNGAKLDLDRVTDKPHFVRAQVVQKPPANPIPPAPTPIPKNPTT